VRVDPDISEELRRPPEPQKSNGVIRPTAIPRERDDRMIYFIIGGILLAFSIGLGFLIFAMMIDWH